MNRKIDEATGFQALIDVLTGATTVNLGNKNVYSAQNSLVDPSMSTAGDFAVNGMVATKAAASSLFALEDTTIPIGAGCNFVLCLNTAGSGIGYATNVLTSAQVSTAGSPANVRDHTGIVWPAIAATMCPVGIYTVIAGSVSHVAGSSSFSLVDSASGSHLFTQILNMNKFT